MQTFNRYLKQTGKRAGIATSNGRDMVDAVLESLHIKSYFQVIATACEVAAGKPAPDIYLEVASGLESNQLSVWSLRMYLPEFLPENGPV